MPFSNPVTLSLATGRTYVTHSSRMESPLAWSVGAITSSRMIRWDRWIFEITRDAGGRSHVGWLKLTAEMVGHTLEANLAQLASARETITICVAFNSTYSEDLIVQLQP